MVKHVTVVLSGLLTCLPFALGEAGKGVARGQEAAAALRVPSQAELGRDASAPLKAPEAAAPTTQAFAQSTDGAIHRLARIDYDVSERARDLGPGLEPSFRFVRDGIRFETYAGAFRGADGTYLSGAGNAVDRSLLLAALLRAKGVPVRFAFGRLPPDRCDVLIKQMFAAGAQPQKAAEASRAADLIVSLRARAARDYARICDALSGKMPTAAMPSRDQLRKELAPHVWVQAKADNKWTDLDTSFPEATPGKNYCSADRTADDLPDDCFQKLTIRLKVDRLDGGSLKSEVPLEISRRVVDLADRQIFLVHASAGGLAAVGHAIAGGGKDVWVPALWVDGEGIPGQPVAFNDSPGGAPAPGAGGALQGVLDGFGAATKADSSPRFVAETLEFVLAAPGKSDETTRQVLCECAGAAWRRTTPLDPKALRPLERDDKGPVAVQAIRNIWVSASRHNMREYAGAMKILADSMARADAPPAGAPGRRAETDFGLQVWPLAMQNFSCVLFGEQLFLPALNDDPSIRFYLDSPRILVFGLSLSPIPGAAGRVAIESSMDLRRDKVCGVAFDPAMGDAVARRKFWYGALEGALEHELAVRLAGAPGADVTVSSTSGLLDGRGVVLLRPPDSAAGWEKLAANRETAARLAESLSADEFAVVPKAVIEGGAEPAWWAVSSTTANTVAVWGRDGHMAVWKNGGGSGDFGRTGGGSSGPGINYVDPNTGDRLVPKKTKGKGGTEYTTLIYNISLPGGYELEITITPRLCKVAFQVYKVFL